MQYVRGISESVSTAWNSINPATLSGAIDVIVVEQPDGRLLCSPFHVRFGKFSLLRPYEKKVEFRVNGAKQDYSMKLGEGGEAFFVFETNEVIPHSLQTSPITSPAASPTFNPQEASADSDLQDVDPLELDAEMGKRRPSNSNKIRPPPAVIYSSSMPRDSGVLQSMTTSPEMSHGRPKSGDWSALPPRPHSEDILQSMARRQSGSDGANDEVDEEILDPFERTNSPPPLAPREAIERAVALSRELAAVDIPTQITDTGDLMLDMSAFKNNDEDALRAEILARKVLTEQLQGNFDVGALIGMDEQGNLWIYSSEEAKEAAMKRIMETSLRPNASVPMDAISDPGYHSDDSTGTASPLPSHHRSESDVGQSTLHTPPSSPGSSRAGGSGDASVRNYAKTLRLTSDQLKALDLKPGENSMSFTVNRATCSAFMFLWKHETPVVISDIDGTITKSDALGHVLNMIGRDWTHAGVAKLYSDISNNGFNIMYLTSRSVGQADTTRAYLAGVAQDRYRLPRGPTILSPDRTMAALRRELYLRKPHIFKMSTLRDILSLYGPDRKPFYAGFGNRLTDQISYRTVNVPRNRIFTINSNAEVSLDLLSLNKLKLSYINMNEIVDHYFPPVSMLIKGGGEEYTDFSYWRDTPLELEDFSASDSEEGATLGGDADSQYAEDEDDEIGEGMGDSYFSRNSMDYNGEGSVLSGEYYEGEESGMLDSRMLEDEDADDEQELFEDGEEGEVAVGTDGVEEDEVVTPMSPVVRRDGTVTPDSAAKEADSDPATPSAKEQKLKAPKFAVQDHSAELITGIKDLAMADPEAEK